MSEAQWAHFMALSGITDRQSASYLYLMFTDRTVDSDTALLDGKYNAAAHLPAITVGYKL